MAIKTYKPYTPARRGMTVSAFDGVDKKAKPERSLLETLKKNSGRNSYGRITVRHRGGGNKRKYRVIDFRRDKLDMPAVVQRLEYDPNRSAFIALVKYEDGELRYVLAPVGLKAGDTILASAAADIKPGNCLPLANIPVGTIIHNGNVHIGKAGRKRHMGIRPTVRGSVMNPNDHPHGGGEGRAPVGRPGPVTPWGKPAMGLKTRKAKNPTNKFIIKRRNGK